MKLIHKDKTTFSKLLLGQPDKPDYQQDQNINININVLERLIWHIIIDLKYFAVWLAPVTRLIFDN